MSEVFDKDSEPALLPQGNALHVGRGLLIAIPGIVVAFVIMAITPQLRLGVPIATLAVLVAAAGLLDLLGAFDDPDDRVAAVTPLRALAAPLGLAAFGLAGTWVLLRLAVAGVLRPSMLAVLVPAH